MVNQHQPMYKITFLSKSFTISSYYSAENMSKALDKALDHELAEWKNSLTNITIKKQER